MHHGLTTALATCFCLLLRHLLPHLLSTRLQFSNPIYGDNDAEPAYDAAAANPTYSEPAYTGGPTYDNGVDDEAGYMETDAFDGTDNFGEDDGEDDAGYLDVDGENSKGTAASTGIDWF